MAKEEFLKIIAGNPKCAWVANQNEGFTSSFSHIKNYYRAFSHDVMVAILVFQNSETAAMFRFKQILWELDSSYVNNFFCSHKFA